MRRVTAQSKPIIPNREQKMEPHTIQNFRDGFAVVFYSGNKRHRISLTSRNKRDAHAEAAEIVREFFKKPTNEITVREILVAYVAHLGDRPSGKRLKAMTAMTGYFASFKPSQIDNDLVRAYMAQRVNLKNGKKVGSETLWTELGALKDAMSFAKKTKLIDPNDVPYFDRPPKPAGRDRPLSRSEVAKLLKAARPVYHLYLALIVLLGTAGRVSAVLELTWDRVDFENNTIDLRISSDGPTKGRAIVPMNPGLRAELLHARQLSDSMYVISYAGRGVKSIKTSFSKARKDAGLENVRTHDIRHTSAVWMLEAGSSIQRISQYLGHTSIHTTFRIYARYQPDHLRAEAAALDVSGLTDVDFDDDGNVDQPPVTMNREQWNIQVEIDCRNTVDFAVFLETHLPGEISEIWHRYRQNGNLHSQ